MLLKTLLVCLLSTSLFASRLAAQDGASSGASGVSASNHPALTNFPSATSPFSAADFVALTNGLTASQLAALVAIASQPQAAAPGDLQSLTNGLTAGELAAFYALGAQPLGPQQQGPLTNSIIVNAPVLNVNFGNYAYAKVGLAAIGQTENDYWNGCYFSYTHPTNTTLPDLLWSDGGESGIDLTIQNAPGDWANGSADPMFGFYTYSYSGGITVTMKNVAAGTYNFYLYGHGPTTDNCTFQLGANQASTVSGTNWNLPYWQAGVQYIVFPGVAVTAGQAVTISVELNPLNYALIAGLQMVRTSAVPSNPPPEELLFNIDCLNGITSGETSHYAAVGETGDYWNCLGPRITGLITQLKYANGTNSSAGLSANGFPGVWADGATIDPMYNDYIYPGMGYSGTMTVTNLPPGAYCVYAYSFDGNFALSVGTNSYGTNTTAYNISGGKIATNPPPWVPGLHYASWTNVVVTAGQPMVLTVMPGLHDGWAVICGLQIFRPLLASYTNTVVAWGPADLGGVLGVPGDLPTVTAVAAGMAHALVVEGVSPAGVEGAVLAWGDNTFGQRNVQVTNALVKLIAAGANHSMVGAFSPLVQYPINVTQDLLLVYNPSTADGSNVFAYYLANRPMVAAANVLALTNCPATYSTTRTNFTTAIKDPLSNWLTANPTKRPQYMVLFVDVPVRINADTNNFEYPGGTNADHSVSYEIYSTSVGIPPFVTHIDMRDPNTTNAAPCTNYVKKLQYFGTNYSPGKLLISAAAGGYAGSNYVLDDVHHGGSYITNGSGDSEAGVSVTWVTNAVPSLLQSGIPTGAILYTNGWDQITNGTVFLGPHLTNSANVAGYVCWGAHSALQDQYPLNYTTDGSVLVTWHGASGWWLIDTIESFNGQPRGGQGNYWMWFSTNAFGSTNYENTPVGAITHTDEPGPSLNYPYPYLGLWAAGKNFAICAWSTCRTPYFQAVGDPFATR
jgi:hypothetical protein